MLVALAKIRELHTFLLLRNYQIVLRALIKKKLETGPFCPSYKHYRAFFLNKLIIVIYNSDMQYFYVRL